MSLHHRVSLIVLILFVSACAKHIDHNDGSSDPRFSLGTKAEVGASTGCLIKTKVETVEELQDVLDHSSACHISPKEKGVALRLDEPLLVERSVTLEDFYFDVTQGVSSLRVVADEVTLREIHFILGDDAFVGAPDASALEILGATSVLLDEVTVTGKGQGRGIQITDSTSVYLSDVTARDMAASPTLPGNLVVGVAIANSQNIDIENLVISNLTPPQTGSGPDSVNTHTIGLLISGVTDLHVVPPVAPREGGIIVRNVGVGVQVGGSNAQGNEAIALSFVSVEEAVKYCVSLDYMQGSLTDSELRQCGKAGVNIESRALSADFSRDIHVVNVDVINAGSSLLFPDTAYGFLVQEGDKGNVDRHGIVIENSSVSDPGTSTTYWGAFSQVTDPSIPVPAHFSVSGLAEGFGEGGFFRD